MFTKTFPFVSFGKPDVPRFSDGTPIHRLPPTLEERAAKGEPVVSSAAAAAAEMEKANHHFQKAQAKMEEAHALETQWNNMVREIDAAHARIQKGQTEVSQCAAFIAQHEAALGDFFGTEELENGFGCAANIVKGRAVLPLLRAQLAKLTAALPPLAKTALEWGRKNGVPAEAIETVRRFASVEK